jgi:hypothetical protein
MILRTHHQVGLREMESPPLHAGVRQKALNRFQPPPPAKQQDQPYPYVKPNYGAKKQHSQEDDNAPALNKAEKNSSKRSAECSFSLQGWLMGDYSLPSALSRPNRQTRRRKQWCSASNFYILWQHRKTLYSPTEQATWSLQSTATRRISPSPNPAAALEATCSWQEKTKSPSTMGLAVLNISQNNPGRHVIRGGGRTGHPIH